MDTFYAILFIKSLIFYYSANEILKIQITVDSYL